MSSLDSSIPLITVAIATYNRAETLRRALGCIAQLNVGEGDFAVEVVVIDNGSNDHTKDVVSCIAGSCSFPIRYFFESQPGLPFARNRAVNESRGQWIAFFDDDQLTDPHWLSRLYNTARREQVLCVGGSRSLLFETDNRVELTAYCRQLLGEINQAELSDYHFRNLPCTGNVLIHCSLFESWGKFDEITLDGGEDSDFFNRIILGGVRCVYDPAATVEHIIPPNRLDRDYLELIAFRHGRHVCRRDIKHRGRLVTYLSATARVLLVGLSTSYRITMASLAAQRNEVVSQSCKWRRACGYWSFAFNNPVIKTDRSARTMHRGR
jgi:glycosyltransferase involved in cell wall biosynthesis